MSEARSSTDCAVLRDVPPASDRWRAPVARWGAGLLPDTSTPARDGCADAANRTVAPFLNGAGPSTTWSERSSRVAGGLEAASGAGRGQHAAPGARSARTNGVEAVAWSTQDFARRRRRLCGCGDRLQTRWA